MSMTSGPSTRGHQLFQGPQPSGDYAFFQVAWIVPDLMEACRKWTRVYGAGPFHVLPRRSATVLYRGQETVLETQLAITQMGPVQIELIEQPNDTPSVYRDIFGMGEGGVHHMCTFTSDYETTKRHYEGLGYPLIAEIRGALKVGYFDSFADFGFITEVVEEDAGFRGHLESHARICAEWDGTDPIRILQRGGYRTPD
ncbi:MAG: VOC family protein [Sphingobium sp.]